MASINPNDFGNALAALRPRLRRFALGLTGTQADAEDLVQETLERALTRAHQWKPGTRLDSWLYRIAQTIRLNHLAALKVRERHLETERVEHQSFVDGREDNENKITVEFIERLIGRLPEEQRAALLLISIEGLSYKEASDVMGVPIGTVTSRLARARLALREAVYGSLPSVKGVCANDEF